MSIGTPSDLAFPLLYIRPTEMHIYLTENYTRSFKAAPFIIALNCDY